MKIIISLIIFSISLFGYSYKHLEPEWDSSMIVPNLYVVLEYVIVPASISFIILVFKSIFILKHLFVFGFIMYFNSSGSTEPIIIYSDFGACRVAEDIIEYGEPKFNIDYYNNLNK